MSDQVHVVLQGRSKAVKHGGGAGVVPALIAAEGEQAKLVHHSFNMHVMENTSWPAEHSNPHLKPPF